MDQPDSASAGLAAVALGVISVPLILAFNASEGFGGQAVGLLVGGAPAALIGGGLAMIWNVVSQRSRTLGSAVRAARDRVRIPTFNPDYRDSASVAVATVLGIAVLTLYIGCIVFRSMPFNGLTWGADGHLTWWPQGTPAAVQFLFCAFALCWWPLSYMLMTSVLDRVAPQSPVEAITSIWGVAGYPALMLLPVYT
ncbi:hypothetical protein KV112_20540 [Mycolicibacter sp. MYC123]|uniref:Uncharacterized protein n=1 Tax=[Mycobacterium] zoologicum TaxID=2872311 RepID=A0ABU5YTQ9_9MYCO|nr:hypothetical protein [Mycolicibacter sp. MYC123]MEB3052103.1 hypothetical protein [Mycolicibacter sp. MYC123]